MANKVSTIIFNYNNAKREARNLDDIASDLHSIRSGLESCKGSVSSGWKGDNANAYIMKMDAVLSNLSKIEKNIRNLSATVRDISQRTYDTEMHAIEIAKLRTYNS